MLIAIADDEAEARLSLVALLEEYCALHRLQAVTEQFDSGEAFAAAFAPGKYSIVFLDIYMGALSGMDTARLIYARDKQCRMVFCTSSLEHAVESYHVRAKYYLTKPILCRQLYDAMDVCCQEFLEHSKYIALREGATEVNVLLEDIYYIDCSAKKVCCHLSDRDISVTNTFSELYALLAEEPRFLLCNRNVLVNMNHIAGAQKEFFLLANNVRVPMRIRGRTVLRKAFVSYSTQILRER